MTVTPGILTLTTDFGGIGSYVASIKGVVLGLAPGTQLVDVTHSVSPQNILEGGFVLAEVVPHFPVGTVHLAVVDPGVGTARRLVAVLVEGHWFVLPDNGLIGGVLRGRDPSGVWEISNPKLRRAIVSPTFHGRDILGPAAAHLLLGRDPIELGRPLDDLVLPSEHEPDEDEQGLTGEVIFIDAFGNLITNVACDRLGSISPDECAVEILGRAIDGIIRTYADRASGSLVALVGSSGRVEVAVVNGDAARTLQALRGTSVLIRRRKDRPA